MLANVGAYFWANVGANVGADVLNVGANVGPVLEVT